MRRILGGSVARVADLTNRQCPCGTGNAYADCCEPLHDGRVSAETAERLMRSRFAAYALGRVDYVFRTWHPRTRPTEVNPDPSTTWVRLEVLSTEAGGPDDEDGTVEFSARYDDPDGPGVLTEHSRFVRRRGLWVYLDGDVLP